MRTIFFLFAMLTSVAANAAVTVTPLSTDYATKKVTFKVAWTNSPTAPYNNRVWIWIDFCPISGVTPQNFSTATITSPAKTGGNGTITNATARGFFIEYNTTNAGTTVTATLSNAPTGKFNWCVYGSDYPPNVTFDKGTYTFKGTTDFVVSNPAQTITTKTVAKTNLTVTSSTTFTDATGYPGIGSLYCPYTGSDLYMDATHLCRQRTSGAKNWEAYIKDTRDSELYRIVYMPDNKWWLAQNVKLASYGGSAVGSAISGCTKDECGRCYTWAQAYASYNSDTYGSSGNVQGICPLGWLLPVTSNYEAIVTAIGSIAATLAALRALNATCTPKYDTYGFAEIIGVQDCVDNGGYSAWYTNDYYRDNGFVLDWNNYGSARLCGNLYWKHTYSTNTVLIRCFRQL
ncbi:MAG: hypothetical protein LBG31_06045 [Prevotellaceae bacterium]|nr:hypothetical protein [Prevotellaceae bacterium]